MWRAAALAARLDSQVRRAPPPIPRHATLDERTRRRLQALGYLRPSSAAD
jgi:hypothetical protein